MVRFECLTATKRQEQDEQYSEQARVHDPYRREESRRGHAAGERGFASGPRRRLRVKGISVVAGVMWWEWREGAGFGGEGLRPPGRRLLCSPNLPVKPYRWGLFLEPQGLDFYFSRNGRDPKKTTIAHASTLMHKGPRWEQEHRWVRTGMGRSGPGL